MSRHKSGNGQYPFERTVEYCPNENGTIYGVLYRPQRAGKLPCVIFSHELGSTHGSGEDYAEHFAALGIAVYIFDFRNGSFMSRSGNDMSKMSVFTERDDLFAVLEMVKAWDFVDKDRIVLLGASQGGFVSTMAATERPDEIAGLICIYPALLIQEDVHSIFPSLDAVPETFSYRGWFSAGRCYAADVWDYDIYAEMPKYKKPMLLLHGNMDGIVSRRYSERAARAFPDAECHVIPGGGHGFYGHALKAALNYMTKYLQRIGVLPEDGKET